MTISERLFRIMEEKNISMSELSRLTGISRHTIFDWHKKNTNPGSDKIMAICRALEITPEQLLTGEGIDDVTEFKPITERAYADRTDVKLLEDYHGMQEDQKKRLLAYVEALKKIESLEDLIERENVFTMEEFEKSVNAILEFRQYKILKDNGRISHKQAMDKANAEYEIFNKTQPIESDSDKAVKRMIKEQADV